MFWLTPNLRNLKNCLKTDARVVPCLHALAPRVAGTCFIALTCYASHFVSQSLNQMAMRGFKKCVCYYCDCHLATKCAGSRSVVLSLCLHTVRESSGNARHFTVVLFPGNFAVCLKKDNVNKFLFLAFK